MLNDIIPQFGNLTEKARYSINMSDCGITNDS